MENPVTLEEIWEATAAMEGVVVRTPVVTAKRLSPNLFFKAENLQHTGSFKLRGAFNKIRLLSDEECRRGVIACSAGNHAQGVALSATARGIRSIVCMPESAPRIKQEATRGYGAEVIAVPGNYDDSAKEAARLRDENDYVFVHPFDDPAVIAGQGTVGLEILAQLPDVEQIVVPVGGGGLISGIALAVKALKPTCRVIGVQTLRVPSMAKSFAFDNITTVKDNHTVADGIHVLTPGNLTFEMVSAYVDDIVLVSEEEICGAVAVLLDGPKLVAEGAGAAAAAAFLFKKIDTTKKTACVVSGGNVDLGKLSEIMNVGLQKLSTLSPDDLR